jgi:L,D-transpeptidase catalytic domain
MERGPYLRVDVGSQTLHWMDGHVVVQSWPISTAKNGVGEQRGSEKTPRGWHKIRARIGEGEPPNAVFRGRRPTGEIYGPELERTYPGRDWILTRILWLVGLEPGFNRYGPVDTGWRYIYIHGSPDQGVTGEPLSHGCIRMKCSDMLDLFDRVTVGMRVYVAA